MKIAYTEEAGVLLVSKAGPDEEYIYQWVDSVVVPVRYSNAPRGQS